MSLKVMLEHGILCQYLIPDPEQGVCYPACVCKVDSKIHDSRDDMRKPEMLLIAVCE
jgi:hypothetical protein